MEVSFAFDSMVVLAKPSHPLSSPAKFLETPRPPIACQILVDTVNLDTEAKRATERDVAAAEQLSSRVSWKSSSPQGS